MTRISIARRFVFSRVVVISALFVLCCGVADGRQGARNIGPTGITGTIAKQSITVSAVDKGSPADGIVKKGDVIVGVGDRPFKGDVVRSFAAAIDEAETVEAGGTLPLLLQGGQSVDIPLRVLGRYSETAPYHCPKTDKIIDQLAESLVNSGKLGENATKSGLLGLMATGEQKYIDVAATIITSSDRFKPDAERIDAFFAGGELDLGGSAGWAWGYDLITLGEYYLLTRDDSVLPAMRIYALALARGQDAGGLWGHRMARNGRLPGYAQMNQPSLTNFMGMLFAWKCGIRDPVLKDAIRTTYAYVEGFVGEGAFPYGVHGWNAGQFNNNGTSGSAAVAMSLSGNQEGAAFFSKLSATSYDGLEQGHASTFFNPFWTPLGAHLSGPEVAQPFFANSRWYHNLRRRWDGGYGVSGKEGPEAGYALLTYCLPRKALIITGREAEEAVWIKGEAAEQVMMMSKVNYGEKSVDALIQLQDHPIPQVSRLAMLALQRKPVDEALPKVHAVLASGGVREQSNILGYFGNGRPKELESKELVDTLGTIVRDGKRPLKVRVQAALTMGFGGYNELGYPYYFDIIDLLDVDRETPDPFGFIDRDIAYALDRLCRHPFEADLVSNKDRFYKAALRFMDHKRQEVRGCGTGMLVGMPPEDFHLVADKMIHVLENKDPTYHSYHNAFNTSMPVISVLADLGIKEGMDYMLDIIFNDTSKWGFRYRMVMDKLPLYGGNAKPFIPKFEAHPNINKEGDRFTPRWQEVVRAIREDTNPRKLTTLEEVRARRITRE